MKLAWIGSHFEGLEAFTALCEAGIPFCAAITLDEASAAKRSGSVDFGPVCERFDVRLIRTSDINSEETVSTLRSLQIDLGVVIGWSQILRTDTLATSRFGWIGAHASMLPKNRGSAPVNWALIRGEQATGNSLIWLTERVDEGNLIAQRPIEITPFDTCATIYQRIGETNRDMLLEVVPRLLDGKRMGEPQPQSNDEVLPRRRPKDGLIDWCRSGSEIYNFVRALTEPYPGAFSFLDGKRYKIWEAALLPIESMPESTPGDVVGPMISPATQSCGQLVNCGQGVLAVLDVEEHDGKRFRGPDLAALDWRGKRWRHVA